VVKVGDNNASDFGYVTFSFTEVQTISFSVAVFVYGEQTKNFELTNSRLYVTSGTDALFNKDIANVTNSILVKDGYTTYHVKVTKDGYITYERILRLMN